MAEYRSASGSSAEDLFIELFADTFGAEKAGYLYSQYPFYTFIRMRVLPTSSLKTAQSAWLSKLMTKLRTIRDTSRWTSSAMTF